MELEETVFDLVDEITEGSREKYLDVCHRFLRKPSKDDRNILYAYLKKSAKDAGVYLAEVVESAKQYKGDDYLHFINVVSMQFAILSSIEVAKKNRRKSLDNLDNLFHMIETDVVVDKTNLHNLYVFMDFKRIKHVFPTTKGTKRKGLIVVGGELEIDDLIIPYLDGNFVCGLAFDDTFADGYRMDPVEMIYHDYLHYNIYEYCLENGHDNKLDDSKKLWEMISDETQYVDYPHQEDDHFKEPKNAIYAAKTVFFINIHESPCGQFIRYSRMYTGRYMNFNDLNGLIPEKYRIHESKREKLKRDHDRFKELNDIIRTRTEQERKDFKRLDSIDFAAEKEQLYELDKLLKHTYLSKIGDIYNFILEKFFATIDDPDRRYELKALRAKMAENDGDDGDDNRYDDPSKFLEYFEAYKKGREVDDLSKFGGKTKKRRNRRRKTKKRI